MSFEEWKIFRNTDTYKIQQVQIEKRKERVHEFNNKKNGLKHPNKYGKNIYKIGKFKIFYSLAGKNKLPEKNKIDSNNNGIPDYIESIGTQLNDVSKLFSSAHYIHPLDNQRYKDKAYFIMVSVVSMKSYGTAYDGVNRANKKSIERTQPSLAMKISNNLPIGSPTPLHEYFHLIQNGYTMFKNRWYTEGTARWSESMLKNGIGENKPLPQTSDELTTILSQTYKTSYMWNRLTYLIDDNNCYLNTKESYPICGTKFMRKFLENLMKYDKRTSQEMKYSTYDWKEAKQKSSINNKYILLALADTIRESRNSNKEVNNFLNLLYAYSKQS